MPINKERHCCKPCLMQLRVRKKVVEAQGVPLVYSRCAVRNLRIACGFCGELKYIAPPNHVSCRFADQGFTLPFYIGRVDASLTG